MKHKSQLSPANTFPRECLRINHPLSSPVQAHLMCQTAFSSPCKLTSWRIWCLTICVLSEASSPWTTAFCTYFHVVFVKQSIHNQRSQNRTWEMRAAYHSKGGKVAPFFETQGQIFMARKADDGRIRDLRLPPRHVRTPSSCRGIWSCSGVRTCFFLKEELQGLKAGYPSAGRCFAEEKHTSSRRCAHF